jgi:hypothetical protein
MKFYIDKYKNNFYYWNKTRINKLNAILNSKNALNYAKCVYFFKNGKFHNTKNAAYIEINGYKQFFINGHCYGYNDFTKKSWRRFVKLKAFL